MSKERAISFARSAPVGRPVSIGATLGENRPPTSREKAAIIVRLLLSEGESLPLAELPEELQTELGQQMGQLRLVDRETLASVISEFTQELEDVGLSFPNSLESALDLMDGHISPSAANRLRRMSGSSARADPWMRVVHLPADTLFPILEAESTEVAAVLLSKLDTPKAAALLGRLPGERARRVAYAVSLTGAIDPDTVRRIGFSLAHQLDAQPAHAFAAGPVERVGAILNLSTAATRDRVLDGLETQDAAFADLVRKAIFTFSHIPQRIAPRDVPKIIRLVAPEQMVTAIAAALENPRHTAVADYLLNSMSQRMAQSLRDEVEARGKVSAKEAEEAMTGVIAIIRQLEDAGELVLKRDEE